MLHTKAPTLYSALQTVHFRCGQSTKLCTVTRSESSSVARIYVLNSDWLVSYTLCDWSNSCTASSPDEEMNQSSTGLKKHRPITNNYTYPCDWTGYCAQIRRRTKLTADWAWAAFNAGYHLREVELEIVFIVSKLLVKYKQQQLYLPFVRNSISYIHILEEKILKGLASKNNYKVKVLGSQITLN